MRLLPVTAAFGHVVRSTLHNLAFAWHLSWPWMLVILPLNLIANLYGMSFDPAAPEPSGLMVALSLLVGLVTMFSFASIAVSWHRYILLDEVPRGLARLRADNTVWRYFGNTILIILILAGALLPAIILAALLSAALGNLGIILSVPIYLAAFVFVIAAFYRLSVKLPAIALERSDFGMKEAWAATENNVFQLFGLALLMALALFGAAAVLGGLVWLLEKTGVSFALYVGIALQIVFNWVITVMGVTLLTSLYGYFVEKRDF